jgi:NADH:ubiquinone reductase (H+-translocating)
LDQLARTSLMVGATVAAVSVLRRAMKPRPGHAPSEKPTYGAFPNRVLVVGGGFAGYMAAKTLCDLTEDRDDVGVLMISRMKNIPQGFQKRVNPATAVSPVARV